MPYPTPASTIETVTLPAGHYAIGDPCNLLPEVQYWALTHGTSKEPTGCHFYEGIGVADTGGDGWFLSDDGLIAIPVDTARIALIPMQEPWINVLRAGCYLWFPDPFEVRSEQVEGKFKSRVYVDDLIFADPFEDDEEDEHDEEDEEDEEDED